MIPARTPLWSTRPRRVSPEGRARWGRLSKARRCSREYRIPTSHRSPKRGGAALGRLTRSPRTHHGRGNPGTRGGGEAWTAGEPVSPASWGGRSTRGTPRPVLGRPPSIGWRPARHNRLPRPPPEVPGSVPCNVSSISRPSCQNSHLHNGHPAYLPMLTYSCERAKEVLHSLSLWRWLRALPEPRLSRRRSPLRSPSPYALTRLT